MCYNAIKEILLLYAVASIAWETNYSFSFRYIPCDDVISGSFNKIIGLNNCVLDEATVIGKHFLYIEIATISLITWKTQAPIQFMIVVSILIAKKQQQITEFARGVDQYTAKSFQSINL